MQTKLFFLLTTNFNVCETSLNMLSISVLRLIIFTEFLYNTHVYYLYQIFFRVLLLLNYAGRKNMLLKNFYHYLLDGIYCMTKILKQIFK